MPNRHNVAQQQVSSHPDRTDPFLSRSVTDAQARSLISPLTRPESFDEWRILVGDVIHAYRSRSDRRVSEEQIDGWAERGWIGAESFSPKWDHSRSRQQWRGKRSGAVRRSKADERDRGIYARFQRQRLTYAALGALFGVSVATVGRAMLAGRKRCRNRRSRTCFSRALEPYSPIVREALIARAPGKDRFMSGVPAMAEGGQQ